MNCPNNFLRHHIDFPTRGRAFDNPHILDLVVSNADNVESIDYLATLGKSDHSVLIMHVDVCSRINNAIPKLNFNKGNYNELRKHLDIDWDSLLQQYIRDVEMMWNIIKDKLLPSTLPFTYWKKDKWKKPLDVCMLTFIFTLSSAAVHVL